LEAVFFFYEGGIFVAKLREESSGGSLPHVFRTHFAGKHGAWNVDHALTPGTFVGMKDRLVRRNDELTPGRQPALQTLRGFGVLFPEPLSNLIE
jgi:hypothetical protein